LKWARTFPSLIYFSWVIYRVPPPPPYPNIKVLYLDSSRHISVGAKGSGSLRIRHPDRKWRHMKWRDRRDTSENADVIENTLGVLYNTSNY
jgi:hypothetical protein